jgi:hypothetical protein
MPTLSKKVKSLTTKTAEARLAKMRLQVDRLRMENKRLKGEVGPIDKFRREVVQCNVTVKTQFAALGPRLAPQLATMADPREIAKLLTDEVTSICNDLAYERERPINTCPTCNARLTEKTEVE